MRKSIVLLLVLILLGTVFTGCTKKEKEVPNKQFTVESLAKYNGKDGKPAYIAVDGLVYDVTDNSSWKGGEHHGFSTGQDLTAEFENEHGKSKLRNLAIMGTYVD